MLPVIAAGVIAAVAAPLVGWLQRQGVPRWAGAILLLLAAILLGALVVFIVLAGITSQSGDLSAHLDEAKNTIEGWLEDLGVELDDAENATQDADSSATQGVSALLDGLGTGLTELSSLLFFLAMTALSLVFLLADGPKIRAWGERHMGVPAPVARTISTRTLRSLGGYFLGVTLVAAFNAAVVGLGALLLGVPLAGTIAVVTLLAAFVRRRRYGRRTRHSPARRPDRHDQRRSPLRCGGADPRCAHHIGRDPNLGRPIARPGRGRAR